PECVMTGRWSATVARVPMVCALINHPKHGLMLFDVGYSNNFFKASRHFPQIIYRWTTPVKIEKTLKEQLVADGVDPKSIAYIFISHFHADHVAALDDFPNATVICDRGGYEYAKKLRGFAAVKKGILPDLIQLFQGRRLQFIDDKKQNSDHKNLSEFISRDIFGDGSLLAVGLPGHARGQQGLYINDSKRGKVFLIADATWYMQSIIDGHPALPIVALTHDNQNKYLHTLHNLHQFYHHNPDIQMIPCHCPITWAKLSAAQQGAKQSKKMSVNMMVKPREEKPITARAK
ncbi:MAG: MBL fold metallo-hydrolase, partial [Alphaproteobacteria bacterium]|nr:MBL fold metallo-hydrolase [Alphaproteobacteria bacterium]